MNMIEITVHLPESLAKQATQMGILTDEYIEKLLRDDIESQLKRMAHDPDIQHELAQINDEFRITEWDGLDKE
ncbi:MAG: hypothetical protein MUE54_14985 [Anaerolineae bacterium]|jgi:hypothetical protein|nr:hypothetical protein [Anaerolineae bacterium]